MYDELLKQYRDPSSPETLKSLNKLCVRIVFCLYAEDAGLFVNRNQFHDYLCQFDAKHVRNALIELFQVLNTPETERDPYLEETLANFPYVNGGLFADEEIEIPQMNEEIVDLILRKGSQNFDWSQISPTIFGSLFESTLNPETRKEGGMHYTSVENIHKVIDPLFLDDLRKELNDIRALKTERTRNERLSAYQNKLSTLKFLDPACGSGNFLTETYLCLRRLENEVISILSYGQMTMGDIVNPIKVSIEQFYGIEINDFAVSVAQTALWIAESQMRQETAEIVYLTDDYLPLKSLNHIVEGNALTIDWHDVVPNTELSYIVGNPPFWGASKLKEEQKSEIVSLFNNSSYSRSLDYVCGWYIKSAQYIDGTNIKVALVSTNSITQGEQVYPLWTPLLEQYRIKINFAHQTFRWDSEATIKAHVYVVIIAFSQNENDNKFIYTYEKVNAKGVRTNVQNISPYLRDERNILVASQGRPLFTKYRLTKGNQASDGKHFQLTPKDREQLIKQTPELEQYIRPYIGAKDYLNEIKPSRYCLWLKDAPLSIIAKNKEVMSRLDKIRENRLKSTAKQTRLKADTPTEFFSNPQKEKPYLLIPRASSENREWIPMSFMGADTIASDAVSIVTEANEYLYGILISRVHMTWMRAVCGRLEGRYRYSGGVVFNNFVFPGNYHETGRRFLKVGQADS